MFFCRFLRMIAQTLWKKKNCLIENHTILTFNDPKKEAFGNNVGKEENAGNQHFPPFPTLILP